MDVLMVYNYDPFFHELGGGRKYVDNLINYLCENDIQVTLLGIEKIKHEGLPDKNIKFNYVPILKNSLLNFGDPGSWWKYFLKLMSVSASIKLSDSTIIHTHHPLFMLPFILNKKNNPKVCTLHGLTLNWVKMNYSFLQPVLTKPYITLEEKIIENTDIIATAGSYPKNHLKKRYPNLTHDKIIEVPSGVDLNIFKPMDVESLKIKYKLSSFSNIIIFVGRIARIKNLELLLKSFSLAKNNLEKPILLIVGKGESESEIKEYINNKNIEDVVFWGEANTCEVSELLNCSDLLALTSWSESSPTVVKEALACGIPVVSTDVGDVRTIIRDSLLGIIVNSYDPDIFAESLIKMIEIKKNNLEKVRIKCRETALNKFSFKNIVDQYISIYKNLR